MNEKRPGLTDEERARLYTQLAVILDRLEQLGLPRTLKRLRVAMAELLREQPR